MANNALAGSLCPFWTNK